MSIWGQVNRQTARGEVLRSGAGRACCADAPRNCVTLIHQAARKILKGFAAADKFGSAVALNENFSGATTLL